MNLFHNKDNSKFQSSQKSIKYQDRLIIILQLYFKTINDKTL